MCRRFANNQIEESGTSADRTDQENKRGTGDHCTQCSEHHDRQCLHDSSGRLRSEYVNFINSLVHEAIFTVTVHATVGT